MMDDREDPILQFFSQEEADQDDVLYSSLSVSRTATAEDIRKAYRKAALRLHPDKHASKPEEERKGLSAEFQKVGFAYAVLSDDKKRKRYDDTGRTDESAFSDAEEMGWDAYFETLFQRIDRKALDQDKQRYQGSEEELSDIVAAYNDSKGDFEAILSSIPHSTHDDESRLKTAVEELISAKRLKATKTWTKSSGDAKAANKRKKASAQEAKEAEEAAKELGVWDEFYGSGEKGARKEKKKQTNSKQGDFDADASGAGEAGLQALILKRQREREGGLDALAAKYAKIDEDRKAKKRAKGKKVDEPAAPSEDISDADFEKLQARLFGAKGKKGND